MLTLSHVTQITNNKTLFTNLSVSITEKSIIYITGGNGSGKTTLLKIISGMKPPSKGMVLWDNQPITEIIDDYRRAITYIGHENACPNKLTVEEYLKYWSLQNHSQKAIDATIFYFNLEEILSSKYESLSKGMQRRLAISRLLLSNSLIWLLDEPFSNLDTYNRQLLGNILNSKLEEGGIVILTDNLNQKISGIHRLHIDNFA